MSDFEIASIKLIKLNLNLNLKKTQFHESTPLYEEFNYFSVAYCTKKTSADQRIQAVAKQIHDKFMTYSWQIHDKFTTSSWGY